MMRSVSVVRVPSVATDGEWKIMVQKSSVYQTQASVTVKLLGHTLPAPAQSGARPPSGLACTFSPRSHPLPAFFSPLMAPSSAFNSPPPCRRTEWTASNTRLA